MLDLPHPLEPMIAVTPSRKSSVVRSGNDLKPWIFRSEIRKVDGGEEHHERGDDHHDEYHEEHDTLLSGRIPGGPFVGRAETGAPRRGGRGDSFGACRNRTARTGHRPNEAFEVSHGGRRLLVPRRQHDDIGYRPQEGRTATVSITNEENQSDPGFDEALEKSAPPSGSKAPQFALATAVPAVIRKNEPSSTRPRDTTD
jgi:hypothetical protein